MKSGTFWKKIKDASANGLTPEEFSRIEELDGMIVDLEEKLEICREEISLIKKEAKLRLKKEEV